MNSDEGKIKLIEDIKRLFKKRTPVKKGDVGIYHYIWSCDTFNMDTRGLKCDVFVKVEIVEIYHNLVEVKVVDTKISDYVTTDVVNLIMKTHPTYLSPIKVNWIEK